MLIADLLDELLDFVDLDLLGELARFGLLEELAFPFELALLLLEPLVFGLLEDLAFGLLEDLVFGFAFFGLVLVSAISLSFSSVGVPAPTRSARARAL